MSDTPRTKSEAIKYLAGMGHMACDRIEELERELAASKADRAAISQRLSDALDALFASNKQLAEARAEVERVALEIENQQYTITCASEENQQLKESLAKARAEIKSLKLSAAPTKPCSETTSNYAMRCGRLRKN